LTTVKVVRFFAQIISAIIRVIFIFFRLLARVLFYDLLIAIYFKIFRFKKNELAGMPLKKLLSKEMTGSAILIFLFIFLYYIKSRKKYEKKI